MTLNYRLCLFILALTYSYLNGALNAQDILWAKTTWGSQISSINALYVDSEGNCYTTGSYGAKTFDGVSLDGGEGTNAFLAKFNSDGVLIWARTTHRSTSWGSGARGSGICSDKDGNVIAVGSFDYSLTIQNDSFYSHGYSDIFVAKYDDEGRPIWVRQIGGSEGGDYCYDIEVDALGNCYITGTIRYPILFNGNPVNVTDAKIGYGYMFLAKIDPDGNLVWLKIGNGSRAPLIKVSSLGELYFAGEYQHFTKWEQDSISTLGGVDYCMGKIGGDGKLMWLERVGGPEYDWISDIAIDDKGNFFAIGEFGSEFYIGDSSFSLQWPGTKTLVKFDSNGSLDWLSSVYSDTSELHINRIIIDYQGSLSSFGEETEVIDSSNFWNYKSYGLRRFEYDVGTGEVVANKLYPNVPEPMNVGIDSQSNVYLYGFFFNSAEVGDTTLTSTPGNYRAFLAKLGKRPEDRSYEDCHLQVYPNPATDLLNVMRDNGSSSPTRISLVDVQGRVLLNSEMDEDYLTLDIASVCAGIYFVILEKGDHRRVCKIIKPR